MDAKDQLIAAFVKVRDTYRASLRAEHAANEATQQLTNAQSRAADAAKRLHEARAAFDAVLHDTQELELSAADLIVEHTGRGTFSDDYLKTGQNP